MAKKHQKEPLVLLLGQASAGQGKLRVADQDPFVGLRRASASSLAELDAVLDAHPEHDRAYIISENANPVLIASRRSGRGGWGLTPAGRDIAWPCH